MHRSDIKQGMPVKILPKYIPWSSQLVDARFPDCEGIVATILEEDVDNPCTIGVAPVGVYGERDIRYFSPDDLIFIETGKLVVLMGGKEPFIANSQHRYGKAMDFSNKDIVHMDIREQKQEAGSKYDAGKPRMDLVPTSALKALGDVLEFGARKYADRNWEKGISWSRLYASTIRHLVAYWDGVEQDEESGLHPLKHALTDIAFLIEFLETHPELDDRPLRDDPNQITGADIDKMLLSPTTTKLLKDIEDGTL